MADLPILSSVSGGIDSLQSALTQYVVSPLNAFGIGGFVFDVEGQSTANLTAEVTDHYAENNSFLQDNIAVRPKQYILRGYVGELVDRVNTDGTSTIATLTQKLTEVNAMLPQLSAGVQQAQGLFAGGGFSSFGSAIDTLTAADSLGGISSLYGAVKNLLPATKQQAAFQFFKSLWMSKILVSLQTPFEFISSMAVINVIAIQQEPSNSIMDFAITLKEIRYAQTKTVIPKSTLSPSSSSGGIVSQVGDAITSAAKNANGLVSEAVNYIGDIGGQAVTSASAVFDSIKSTVL